MTLMINVPDLSPFLSSFSCTSLHCLADSNRAHSLQPPIHPPIAAGNGGYITLSDLRARLSNRGPQGPISARQIPPDELDQVGWEPGFSSPRGTSRGWLPTGGTNTTGGRRKVEEESNRLPLTQFTIDLGYTPGFDPLKIHFCPPEVGSRETRFRCSSCTDWLSSFHEGPEDLGRPAGRGWGRRTRLRRRGGGVPAELLGFSEGPKQRGLRVPAVRRGV